MKEDRGGNFTVGSKFRLARNAPETGYVQMLSKQITRGGGVFFDNMSDDNNYFFRIRSEVDENGKLTRAMYGKIKGEIKVEPRSGTLGMVLFFYYLNPDYTRNLEFDPNRNLFDNLKDSEKIGFP